MQNEDWVRLGWVVLGVAGLLAAWGVVRWPSRTPRCPKCRYDLSGAAVGESGVTCPECGQVTARRTRLYRHPRRWRLAVAASLAAVPATQMVMFRERPDSGWTRWLPTSVLLVMAGKFDFGPCFDTPGPKASMQLALYQRHERFWAWQMRAWLPREVVEAAEEASRAYAVREVWPRGEGVIVHRVPIEVPPLGPGSIGLMASLKAGPRDGWRPRDLSLVAAFSSHGVGPGTMEEANLGRDDLDLTAGASVLMWHDSPLTQGTGWHRELVEAGVAVTGQNPLFPTIGTHLSVHVTIVERRDSRAIRWVDSLDEAIAPVRGDAHLDGLMEAFRGYRLYSNDPTRFDGLASVLFDDAHAAIKEHWPVDTAACFSYSLTWQGVEGPFYFPDLTRRCLFPSLGHIPRFRSIDASRAFQESARRHYSGDDAAWDGWTLVIEGDGLAALRETLAPKYWAGRIEIPFRPVR